MCLRDVGRSVRMSILDIIPFPCDRTSNEVPNISFWVHQAESVTMSANKKHKETRLKAHLSPTPTRVVRIPATDVSAVGCAAPLVRKAAIGQLFTVAPSVRAAETAMEKIELRNRTFTRWLLKCGRQRRKLLLRELRSDLINNGLPSVQLRKALRQLAQQTVVCVERLTDLEIHLHTERRVIGDEDYYASYMQKHYRKCDTDREDMNKEKHKLEKGQGCAVNNHLPIKNINGLKRGHGLNDYHNLVEKSIGRAKFKKFKDREETELHNNETIRHTKTEKYFNDKNYVNSVEKNSDSKCENDKINYTSPLTKERLNCLVSKRTSDAKCNIVRDHSLTGEKHKKSSYQDKTIFPVLSVNDMDTFNATEETTEYASSKNCNSIEPSVLKPDVCKVLKETERNEQTVEPVTSTPKIIKGKLSRDVGMSRLSQERDSLCDSASTSSILGEKFVYTCSSTESATSSEKNKSEQMLSLSSETLYPETVMPPNVPEDGKSSSSHTNAIVRKSNDAKMEQPTVTPVASDLKVTANETESLISVTGPKRGAVVTLTTESIRENSYTLPNKRTNDTVSPNVNSPSLETSSNKQMSSRNMKEVRDKEVEEGSAVTQDQESIEPYLKLKVEVECDRENSENSINVPFMSENDNSVQTEGFELHEHSKNIHSNALFSHNTIVDRSEMLTKVDLASPSRRDSCDISAKDRISFHTAPSVLIKPSSANDKDVAVSRNNKHRLSVENKVNDTAICELENNVKTSVESSITAAAFLVRETSIEKQNKMSQSVVSGSTNSQSGQATTKKSNISADNYVNTQISDTLYNTKLQDKTSCSAVRENKSSTHTTRYLETKKEQLRLTSVSRPIPCSSGSSTGKESSHTENDKKKVSTMPLETSTSIDTEGQCKKNGEALEPEFATKDHGMKHTLSKTKILRTAEAETSLKRPHVHEEHETDWQGKRLKELPRASGSSKRKSKLSLKFEELFGVDESDADNITGGQKNAPEVSKTQNIAEIEKEIPQTGNKSTALATVKQRLGEPQQKFLPSSRKNKTVEKSSVAVSNKTRTIGLNPKGFVSEPKLKQKIEQSLVNGVTKRDGKENAITGRSQDSERSKSAKEKVMQNWFSDATNPPACSKSKVTKKDTVDNPHSIPSISIDTEGQHMNNALNLKPGYASTKDHSVKHTPNKIEIFRKTEAETSLKCLHVHDIPWQLKEVDLPNVSVKSRKHYFRQSSAESKTLGVAKVGMHKRNSVPPVQNKKSAIVDEQTFVREDDILSSVQGRRHSDTEFNGINVNDKQEEPIDSSESVLRSQTNNVSVKTGTLQRDIEGERNICTSNEKGILPISQKTDSPRNENLETENVEVPLTSVIIKDEASDENEPAAQHHDPDISELDRVNSSIRSGNDNEDIDSTPSVENTSSDAVESDGGDNLETRQHGGAGKGIMQNMKENIAAEILCSETGIGVITVATKQTLHPTPEVHSINHTMNEGQGQNEVSAVNREEEPKDNDTLKKKRNDTSVQINSKATKENPSVINNTLGTEPKINKDEPENPIADLQLREKRQQHDGEEAVSSVATGVSFSSVENKIGTIRVKDPLSLGIDCKRLDSDYATRVIENYVKSFPPQIQNDLTELTSFFVRGFIDIDRYKARINDAEKCPGTSREIELTCARKDFVLSIESKCRVVITKVNFLKNFFRGRFDEVLHTFVNKRRPCTTEELDLLYQTFVKQHSQNINLDTESSSYTQTEKTKGIFNHGGGNNTPLESQSSMCEVKNSQKHCHQKVLGTDKISTAPLIVDSQSVNKQSEQLNDAINLLAYYCSNREQGCLNNVYQGNNSSLQPVTMARVKNVQRESASATDSMSSQTERNDVEMLTARSRYSYSSDETSSRTSNFNEIEYTRGHREHTSQHQHGSLQSLNSLVEQMPASHQRQVGHTRPHSQDDQTRHSFPPSSQQQPGSRMQPGCLLPGQQQPQPGCPPLGQTQTQTRPQPGCPPPGQTQTQTQMRPQPGCPPPGQTQTQTQMRPQPGCPPPGQTQTQMQPQPGCPPPGQTQTQTRSQPGCPPPGQTQPAFQQPGQTQPAFQQLGQPQPGQSQWCCAPQNQQQHRFVLPGQPQFGHIISKPSQVSMRYPSHPSGSAITLNPNQLQEGCLLPYTSQSQVSCPPPYPSYMQAGQHPSYQNRGQMEQLPTKQRPQQDSYLPSNQSQLPTYQIQQQYESLLSSQSRNITKCMTQAQVVNGYQSSNQSLPSNQNMSQAGNIHANQSQTQLRLLSLYLNSNSVKAGNIPLEQTQVGCMSSNANQPRFESSNVNDLQVRQVRQVPSVLNRSHTGYPPTNQDNMNHQLVSRAFPQHTSRSTTQVSQVCSAPTKATQMVYQEKLRQRALNFEQTRSMASNVPQDSQLPSYKVHTGKVPSNLTNSVIVGQKSTNHGMIGHIPQQQITAAACSSKVVPSSHFGDAQSITVQGGRTNTTIASTPQNTFQSPPNVTKRVLLRGRPEYQGTDTSHPSYTSSPSVENQVNRVTHTSIAQNSGMKEIPSADANRRFVSPVTGFANSPAHGTQQENWQESRLQQIEQQSNKTVSVIQSIRAANSGSQQNIASISNVPVMGVHQQTINSRTQRRDVPTTQCGVIAPSAANMTSQYLNDGIGFPLTANCTIVNSQIQRSYSTAAVSEVPNSSHLVVCKTVSQNSVARSSGENSESQALVSRHFPNILSRQSVNKKDLLTCVSNEASTNQSGVLYETVSENNKVPSTSSAPSLQKAATSQSSSSAAEMLKSLLRSAPAIPVASVRSLEKQTDVTGADKGQHASHVMVPLTVVTNNSKSNSPSVMTQADKLSPPVCTQTTVTPPSSGMEIKTGSTSCQPVSAQSSIPCDYTAHSHSVNCVGNTDSTYEGGLLGSSERSDRLKVSCAIVEKPGVPLLAECDRCTGKSPVTVKDTNIPSTCNNGDCVLTTASEQGVKMGMNFCESSVQSKIGASSADIPYSSQLLGDCETPSNCEKSSRSSIVTSNNNGLSSECALPQITPSITKCKNKADSELLLSEAHVMRSCTVSVNTALNSPTNTKSTGNGTETNSSSTTETQWKETPSIIISKESENCEHLAHNQSELMGDLQGNPPCNSKTVHSVDGGSTSTVRVETVADAGAIKYNVPMTDKAAQESSKLITEDFDNDYFPATYENDSDVTDGMEEVDVKEFIESDLSVNSEMSVKLSRVSFDNKKELDSDSAQLEIEGSSYCTDTLPADMNIVNKNAKIPLGKKNGVNIDRPAMAGPTAAVDVTMNSAIEMKSPGYGADTENLPLTEKRDNTMPKSRTPVTVSSQSQSCDRDILDVERAEVNCLIEDDEIEIIEDYSPVQFLGYKFAKDGAVTKKSSRSQRISGIAPLESVSKQASTKSTDINSVKETKEAIGDNTSEDANNETSESECLKIVSVVSLTSGATGESEIQWPSSPEPRTVSRDSGYTTPSDGAAHDAQEIHVDGDINCAFCENTAQILCTGCYITCYCSTDCQIRHWREVHYEECKLQNAGGMNQVH